MWYSWTNGYCGNYTLSVLNFLKCIGVFSEEKTVAQPGYSVFSQPPTFASLLSVVHFKRKFPPLLFYGGLCVDSGFSLV